jgi:hypothetical protein
LSRIVDEHRQFLEDKLRLRALDRAIRELIHAPDIVLDLASGTGILGLFACRAGAIKVYSVDDGGMLGLARSIGRLNGFGDRQVCIKGHSSRINLPERVDVIVADQIGRFGFDAGLFEDFDHARLRFLKPGGRLIPSSVQLHVAPVENFQMAENVAFWKTPVEGFDFSSAWKVASNTGYPVKYSPDQILGSPVQGCDIDLYQAAPNPLRLEALLEIRRTGTLHGIGGWFSARLSPSVTMTNSPLARDSINRRNVFFPLPEAVAVNAGDRIRVLMFIRAADLLVTWTGEITDSSSGAVKGRFSQSTLQGMLVPREDLNMTDPSSIPRLNPWGEARRTVLELTDGSRALREIEHGVFQKHPDLFPDPASAAIFTAEVITRYSTPGAASGT